MSAREPEWVILAHGVRDPKSGEINGGVRWLLKRPDGLDVCIAEAKTGAAMATVYSGGAVLADYGFEPDANALDDPDVLLGLSLFIGLCAYAERCLVAWEGVVDEDGEPIEFSPEAIRAALRFGPTPASEPVLLQPFRNWLDQLKARRTLEKNASAPSQNGGSPGETPIAAPAARKARRAPAGSAPKTARSARKSSTRRKPKPAP